MSDWFDTKAANQAGQFLLTKDQETLANIKTPSTKKYLSWFLCYEKFSN